jgi:hypothetical protein
VARSYEIRSGKKRVSVRSAATPQQALIDYLRSLGCSDRDLVRLGTDAVAWRGARYSAVPVASENE